jgi:hypothetical protein
MYNMLNPVCTCGHVKTENTFNPRKFTNSTVGSKQWKKEIKEENSFDYVTNIMLHNCGCATAASHMIVYSMHV